MVGLDGIQPYISARHFHHVKDWSSCPLDDEGRLLQMQMQKASEVSKFPESSTAVFQC